MNHIIAIVGGVKIRGFSMMNNSHFNGMLMQYRSASKSRKQTKKSARIVFYQSSLLLFF